MPHNSEVVGIANASNKVCAGRYEIFMFPIFLKIEISSRSIRIDKIKELLYFTTDKIKEHV